MPTTEERLAVLETKMEVMLHRLDENMEERRRQNDRLEELLRTFERAKGAKYLIVILFGSAVFLGSKLAVILAWLLDGK